MHSDTTGIKARALKIGLIQLMIFFAVSWAGSVQAQAPGAGQPATAAAGGTVTGTVIDSLSKKPVDYATVSIFKAGASTPFSGAVSDDKGLFRITNLPAGTYRVQVNYIGYNVKNVTGVVLPAIKQPINCLNH